MLPTHDLSGGLHIVTSQATLSFVQTNISYFMTYFHAPISTIVSGVL